MNKQALAFYLNKHVVTQYNESMYPQFPIGTMVFQLLTNLKVKDWSNEFIDRDSLKAMMKSGEIEIDALKLDKRDRIVAKYPDISESRLEKHVADQIKHSMYSYVSYTNEGSVFYDVDNETRKFLSNHPTYTIGYVADIVDDVVQTLRDNGIKVYSFIPDYEEGYAAFYSCNPALLPK